MAINKKLINFKKEDDYIRERDAGNILPKSIVFIDDVKKIVTHNTEFDCSSIELASEQDIMNLFINISEDNDDENTDIDLL